MATNTLEVPSIDSNNYVWGELMPSQKLGLLVQVFEQERRSGRKLYMMAIATTSKVSELIHWHKRDPMTAFALSPLGKKAGIRLEDGQKLTGPVELVLSSGNERWTNFDALALTFELEQYEVLSIFHAAEYRQATGEDRSYPPPTWDLVIKRVRQRQQRHLAMEKGFLNYLGKQSQSNKTKNKND